MIRVNCHSWGPLVLKRCICVERFFKEIFREENILIADLIVPIEVVMFMA